jgi:hypothetical protein
MMADNICKKQAWINAFYSIFATVSGLPKPVINRESCENQEQYPLL